jgi:type IV secretory pathway VirB2 component (pilin)
MLEACKIMLGKLREKLMSIEKCVEAISHQIKAQVGKFLAVIHVIIIGNLKSIISTATYGHQIPTVTDHLGQI